MFLTAPKQHGIRGGRQPFDFVISSNVDNWDLDTELTNAGYNGSSIVDVTITVNSGIRVGSTTTATPGMTLQAQTTGSTIALTNNGTINSQGGPSGSGVGGDGLKTRHAVDLTNNNEIYGGGGGGANGAQAHWSDCSQHVHAAGGAGGVGEGNSAATSGAAGQNKTGTKYDSDGCDPMGTYNITGATGGAGGTKGVAAGGAAGNWVDGHSYLNIIVAGTTYGNQTG